jgi:hypothetical protein
MNEYRSPEEDMANAALYNRIRLVLDQAVHDGASMMAAMELDEPAAVVEMWIDRLWDGLRDALTDDEYGDEERLTAIMLLLTERMQIEAGAVLHGVRKTR